MKECQICHKKMPAHILMLHMKKWHTESVPVEEAKPEAVVDTVTNQSVVQPLRFDKVIIFCPKFFMSPDREAELLRKGMPVDKNPTPNVIRDMFQKMWWSIKRNEMKVFEKNVGEYLLKKFGFLIRVEPHEIDKYRKIQADKEYKCHVCKMGEFETDTLIAYQQHMKSHNMSPEAMAMIEEMEAAKPDGEVYSTQEAIAGKPRLDEYAGALTGGTYERPMVDQDGVEWVGPGSVKRQGMKLRPKFGAPGMFRGGVNE
jgi:hypothetical protein